ncbi:MAG: hypothetical protein AAB372_00005 [Patescibacteria group bacterium]
MKTRNLVAALIVAIFVGLAAKPVLAQSAIYDHPICYKVAFARGALQVSTHAGDVLTLVPLQDPILSVERGCTISPKPVMFCAPYDKQPRKGPVGTDIKNDFLIYKMKCPPQPDITQGVRDQFVKGVATIKRKSTARLLLVPAYKISTPPPPCDAIAPHQCGGQCPVGLDCRPGPNDICGCFDSTTEVHCGGNVCNGVCPTGQVCMSGPLANVCDCFPQPTDNCGLNAAGQCGGSCADPTKSCKASTAGVPCACQ